MVCFENTLNYLNYLNREGKKKEKRKEREKDINRRRRRSLYSREKKTYIPKDILLHQSALFSWLCILVSQYRYNHCEYLKQKLYKCYV